MIFKLPDNREISRVFFKAEDFPAFWDSTQIVAEYIEVPELFIPTSGAADTTIPSYKIFEVDIPAQPWPDFPEPDNTLGYVITGCDKRYLTYRGRDIFYMYRDADGIYRQANTHDIGFAIVGSTIAINDVVLVGAILRSDGSILGRISQGCIVAYKKAGMMGAYITTDDSSSSILVTNGVEYTIPKEPSKNYFLPFTHFILDRGFNIPILGITEPYHVSYHYSPEDLAKLHPIPTYTPRPLEELSDTIYLYDYPNISIGHSISGTGTRIWFGPCYARPSAYSNIAWDWQTQYTLPEAALDESRIAYFKFTIPELNSPNGSIKIARWVGLDYSLAIYVWNDHLIYLAKASGGVVNLVGKGSFDSVSINELSNSIGLDSRLTNYIDGVFYTKDFQQTTQLCLLEDGPAVIKDLEAYMTKFVQFDLTEPDTTELAYIKITNAASYTYVYTFNQPVQIAITILSSMSFIGRTPIIDYTTYTVSSTLINLTNLLRELGLEEAILINPSANGMSVDIFVPKDSVNVRGGTWNA